MKQLYETYAGKDRLTALLREGDIAGEAARIGRHGRT